MTVPFLNLTALHAPLKEEMLKELEEVLDNSSFILGPKVQNFEKAFAEFCGVEHAMGVNSGTTALYMALLALNIGPGDEVIVPAMTFVATAEAVRYTGATPVFADVEEGRFTLDPALIEKCITPRTKAIMPVHLYGLMADMPAICAIAEKHGLAVIEDAAQAHGADIDGKRAGQWGDIACFSFYPGKNLGACGEGGCVVTNDAELAHQVQVIRDWGQEGRYNHVRQGFNARMDGFQGAMLGIKLKHLDKWTEARRSLGAVYRDQLADVAGVSMQTVPGDCRHVYHVLAVQVENREEVQKGLNELGIQNGIHYPHAVPHLKSFESLGHSFGDFPVAEQLGATELSLPMCPTLSEEQVVTVCESLKQVLGGTAS
ncbi:DegT/DnrJ/EryC1/StrS family aminotransferase [uncultured Pseudodesulfovibrio sp.]|uniref:DegT/DnrJ/EryC1/StrS family aminotransferase n=1 Tax=uncultured Pseudodesulfovibrio sp. TaxID=2035858 RepID=UPI0029C7F8C1|nr:DegT/DnrJ/EryC1/StrS family aminotransferase [uncultured Pseudodesulfovibrio sp.]